MFSEKNKRQKGSYYEEIAAVFLEKRGLQIREKNFRCRSGEIDLIAQDERYLVFVEVKYRKNGRSGSSFAAVGREKTADHQQSGNVLPGCTWIPEFPPCRFDVVGIDGKKIHWIKNAFDFLQMKGLVT